MNRILAKDLFIAGFEHYEGENVWNDLEVGTKVQLTREPENTFDSNAIAIYFGREQLGYVPKAVAAVLAFVMDTDAGGIELKAAITVKATSSNPWKRLAITVEVANG